MPLVQAARTNREWLKTVAIVGLASVLVAALFGMMLGAPTSLLAGPGAGRRMMPPTRRPPAVGGGPRWMLGALGERGPVRRPRPGRRWERAAAGTPPATTTRGLYRRA